MLCQPNSFQLPCSGISVMNQHEGASATSYIIASFFFFSFVVIRRPMNRLATWSWSSSLTDICTMRGLGISRGCTALNTVVKLTAHRFFIGYSTESVERNNTNLFCHMLSTIGELDVSRVVDTIIIVLFPSTKFNYNF